LIKFLSVELFGKEVGFLTSFVFINKPQKLERFYRKGLNDSIVGDRVVLTQGTETFYRRGQRFTVEKSHYLY